MAECEWEPKEGRPAREDDEPHGKAVVSVGADGRWHLCASCAQLPKFARLKTRKELKPSSPLAHLPEGKVFLASELMKGESEAAMQEISEAIGRGWIEPVFRLFETPEAEWTPELSRFAGIHPSAIMVGFRRR